MYYLSVSIYIHTINLAVDGTRAYSGEHLETTIEWTLRCTWGPLWRKNLFLTTTIQLGMGRGGAEILGSRRRTEQQRVYIWETPEWIDIISLCKIQTLSIPALGPHALLLSFHCSTQFVWFLMHSCQAFIDSCNVCVVYHSCIFLHSLSPTSYTLRAKTALSLHFPLDALRGAAECWWWAVSLLAPPFHDIAID